MHLQYIGFASGRQVIYVLATVLVVISLVLIWLNSRQRINHEVLLEGNMVGDDAVKELSKDDWKYFPIPDDARSVEIYSTPAGMVSASYLVEDKYPARKTIYGIVTELRSRGWNLSGDPELSPETVSSDLTRWTNDAITSEYYGQRAYQRSWEAQWKNEDGDVINGHFLYPRSASNITASNSLFVNFIWQSSETNKTMKLIEEQLIEMRDSGTLQ